MYSLGYDIGSSSVKCAIIDCESGKTIAHGFSPKTELAISSPKPGWAEQDPETWWSHVVLLTKQLLSENSIDGSKIRSIGISYQMHGLVLVDENRHVIRPAIIWCDSRAVQIGQEAFQSIGSQRSLSRLLNSPGNFTASKLRWVQEHEPDAYKRIHKAMLPGEFIAMKLTGEISTTVSGLSEGIYWDFEQKSISTDVLSHYRIDQSLLPSIHPTFSVQGGITKSVAAELGLRESVPVSYRAGDQPNNAFSLNVLQPGEVAATAGTSGVVYGVIDKVAYDAQSRVNPFAHVNHTPEHPRLGVLLCINGTGILNSWLRKNIAGGCSYPEINSRAASIPIGSDGIAVLPFGNGAERMLENRNIGCQVHGVDFNRHSETHLLRAAQEGIVFSFNYGIDIMSDMGMEIKVIRAGQSNMFLSPVFRQTLADVTGAVIQLYDTDGAIGAARGAAIGAGQYTTMDQAFQSLTKLSEVAPQRASMEATQQAYQKWLTVLQRSLS